MLLSATLGAEARAALLYEAAGGRARDMVPPSLGEAIAVQYPLITSANGVEVTTHRPDSKRDKKETGYKKKVSMEAAELLDDAPAIARLALNAAGAAQRCWCCATL